ncbi:hypothetical protein FJY94_07570 [Candidatus Kaiserbacteria bacterium]|nr:hypothetical protein [Candidatus Kaiserbacteria bacterium]
MNESKAIARKLVAQSIKPLVDELDEEVRRKGTSEERAMLAEVHSLMNQLLGGSAAAGAKKNRKTKVKSAIASKGRSGNKVASGKSGAKKPS